MHSLLRAEYVSIEVRVEAVPEEIEYTTVLQESITALCLAISTRGAKLRQMRPVPSL